MNIKRLNYDPNNPLWNLVVFEYETELIADDLEKLSFELDGEEKELVEKAASHLHYCRAKEEKHEREKKDREVD